MGRNFPLLLLFFVALYVLLILPQNRRRKKALALQRAVEPGSRVMLTSGLFGTVVEIDDDAVVIEADEGVHLRFAKAAVLRVIPDEIDELDDIDEDDAAEADLDDADLDDADVDHADVDHAKADDADVDHAKADDADADVDLDVDLDHSKPDADGGDHHVAVRDAADPADANSDGVPQPSKPVSKSVPPAQGNETGSGSLPTS